MKGVQKLMVLALSASTALASASNVTSVEALVPERTALLLIEYQNEWVAEDGWLRMNLVKDKKDYKKAIDLSSDILQRARSADLAVVHVTLQPDSDYQMFGDASFGLRAAIPSAGTWQDGAEAIHPDFAPEPGEHVITERTGASGFAGSNLDSYLRNNDIDTLVLIGFATHVCVESTLREAHDRGYTTYVVTEATGAFEAKQKAYFDEHIAHHFGKSITSNQLYHLLPGKQADTAP